MSIAGAETCVPVAAFHRTAPVHHGAAHATVGNIPVTASVTQTAFATGENQHRCSWKSGTLGDLNGFDARVFEVGTHGGLPATVTWSAATIHNPPGAALQGFFYTALCSFQPGWSGQAPGGSQTIGIPKDAKWLVVIPSGAASDISVTVSAPARTCP